MMDSDKKAEKNKDLKKLNRICRTSRRQEQMEDFSDIRACEQVRRERRKKGHKKRGLLVFDFDRGIICKDRIGLNNIERRKRSG